MPLGHLAQVMQRLGGHLGNGIAQLVDQHGQQQLLLFGRVGQQLRGGHNGRVLVVLLARLQALHHVLEELVVLILKLSLEIPIGVDPSLLLVAQLLVFLQLLPVGAAGVDRQELPVRWQQHFLPQIREHGDHIVAGLVGELAEAYQSGEGFEVAQRIAGDQQGAGIGPILGRTLVQSGLQPAGIGGVA